MYVCICKGVSDRTIRKAVADGADTMRALRHETGCCSQCGKCARAVSELLREERERVETDFTLALALPA
ncbi:(2Fe-2S)-binding protein [Plasticicumulans acidivorans]|uniref:Bacterioferritin-associated ferredoxin n=1 Tax=Plasticicumulans acidivorans TaxID=886464 RepID=A0A317MPS9_9GAMM|nr:(2Fe-2S)-binding protein [Plasticicumulans acidivorans]PWV58511.1 bacterioferritin-associated ferredoxin [Plasticicumulans acidivorans]